MTTEEKLIRWLDGEGVFVLDRGGDPALHVLERFPAKPRTPVAILRLKKLAAAIEAGEFA